MEWSILVFGDKEMKDLYTIVRILNYRGFLRFIPDKVWINFTYKKVFGQKPDLENPRTFNEKMQWMKLYYRNPLCKEMVDKVTAKEYVARICGEKYIIPTLGVWGSFEDIEWEKLPKQFVLKCNHDSGGLVICRDKQSLDIELARKKINKCLKHNYFWHGREWVYKDIKPKILAETYMEDSQSEQLRDYKFYCFNGVVKCLYVSMGMDNHRTAQMGFFDLGFNQLFSRTDYNKFVVSPSKPKNFDEMICIAEKLSKGFPFLRVDLYEVNGNVYFSELTFIPSGGMARFEPEEWDGIMGTWLELP